MTEVKIGYCFILVNEKKEKTKRNFSLNREHNKDES